MNKEIFSYNRLRGEVKNMKKKALSILFMAAAALMFSQPAGAFSFSTPYIGPVQIKYNDWEVAAFTPGDPLFGIFKVSSIVTDDGSVTTLWSSSASEELTGYFSGFSLLSVTPLGSTTEFDFTGGSINMFLDSTPDFNASFPGSGYADGSLFLSAVFTPGITVNPLVTLHSVLTSSTIPFTGSGSGYASITGGSFASTFNSNGFVGGADLFISSNLNAPLTGVNGWPVGSFDPVSATVVPEPGTMLLLGSGFLGAAMFGRMLRRKKD